MILLSWHAFKISSLSYTTQWFSSGQFVLRMISSVACEIAWRITPAKRMAGSSVFAFCQIEQSQAQIQVEPQQATKFRQ